MRAALCVVLLAYAPCALAEQYETDIKITTELDLNELHANGEISDETLETLLDLYQNGVNLSTASREEIYALPGLTYAQADEIILYRSQVRGIDDPADLVAAGILTAENLDQIAPFLLIGETPAAGTGFNAPIHGRVRLLTAYTVGDPYAPPAFLQVRARGPFNLTAGLAASFTRRRLGSVRDDPARPNALTAPDPGYGAQVPKFFLKWKGEGAEAIAGHFRLGFGQRLTLDNTSRPTPDGIYPDDLIRVTADLSGFCQLSAGGGVDPCTADEDNLYVTPDFAWSEGFRGLAGRLEHLSLGSLSLQLTGFASYQSKSIYQYDLYDPSRCPDPTDDSTACDAPPVFADSGARFSFQTLPGLHDELAYGGHAALKLGGRGEVGLTGFHAMNFWRVALPLDFQDSARQPFGGPYGAIGVDGAWGFEIFNFYGEVARSFDSEPGGGGGFAAISRSTMSYLRQEVELTLRYYDREYVNPLSRPISAADEFEGNRNRNETGVRGKYTGRFEDFSVRTQVDLYTLPEEAAVGTAGFTTFDSYVRGDYRGLDWIEPSLWLYYRNKNLGQGGAGECFETSFQNDSFGRSIPCNGEQYRVQGKVEVNPLRELSVSLQYQHEWLTDRSYPTALRQDHAAWLIASYKPLPELTLRVRSKYLNEDLWDDDTGSERSLWSYLSASWLVKKLWAVQLRYDNFAWLDQRSSTLTRRPSPEHRFRLEVEARF